MVTVTKKGNTGPLKADKFEGLLVRYPLHREGNKTLYWTIEHHADVSLGGYEVDNGKTTRVFLKLREAIDYFNGGKQK